jgi:GMP synthase-like glutamine amidotransferase
MRALFIQQDHVSPTGPVGEAFRARGYDVVEFNVVPAEHYSQPNISVTFPDPLEYDVIVPMGAPWGVYREDEIGNWIHDELELLRKADNAGIPVFGICFGGQSLAAAHGGSVQRSTVGEIGWTMIESDEPRIANGPWFQWHNDCWSLPPGAQELARNEISSQAFRLRRNLALQFHPEITSIQLQEWLDNEGREYLLEHGYDPDAMMRTTKEVEVEAVKRTRTLVDFFLDEIATAE